jgi:hypothetical protein
MAIYCEAISIIVRKSSVESIMNLAPAELMLRFPGGSLWDDENLIRFGFMTPQDTGVWVRQLEDLGLVFYDQVDSGFRSRDIVVVDQRHGPTCECSWIETEIRDGIRWAWEAGKPPGSFDPPVDLANRNMRYVPLAESIELPWSSDFSSQLDITIDQGSGQTRYVGRPYIGQQLYDAHIRTAIDEVNLDHPLEAFRLFQEAEKIKSLDSPHRIPAAIALTRVVLENKDIGLIQKALLRWKEITEIGPGEESATCWTYRAAVEQMLGLNEDSQNSRKLAVTLKAKGLY